MTRYRSPEKRQRSLGQRVKTLRLHRNLSQQTLANRAGVSRSSVHRFENTGRGTVDLMIGLAYALDIVEPIDDLFPEPEATTMAELKARKNQPTRQRGRGSQ